MKRIVLCGLMAVLVLVSPRPAPAQNQIMRGAITGLVDDAQALAVPGAAVRIVDVDSGAAWETVTDADGRYARYGLDPGTYRVEASVTGFSEFVSDPLPLRGTERLALDIRLAPAGLTEAVTVRPARATRRTDYASPANYVTEEQIASLNTPTVEDVLNYQPGVVVRRRYIGDSNGTLGMRGANMFQTARSMVYADGVPLHNPLQTRWNGAPRWSLVAPDEVESAEVILGPFSAEYGGNAMGGVVKFSTRLPDRRTLRVDGSLFGQTYRFDGADDALGGGRMTTSYGDRYGRFAFQVLHNRLDNHGQPQNFIRETGATAAAGQPLVSGAFNRLDEEGSDAVVYGNTGVADVRTDLVKLKAGHEHSQAWSSRWTLAFENRHDETRTPENYLRNANGATIWGDGANGTADAVFDGAAFNVRNDLFGVGERTRESLFAAWDVNGEIDGDWLVEATLSRFSVLRDESVESNFNPADPLDDGTGAVTGYDDTGWTTLDVKLRDPDLFGDYRLNFAGGYHFSAQELGLFQFASADYRAFARSRETNAGGGETAIHALFAQLGWRARDDWELTVGGRQEFWQSRGGFASRGSVDVMHPTRHVGAFSPKASVGWEPGDRVRLQYSLARAHRFPLVEELFDNQVRTFGSVLGDVLLEPEDGVHHNVSLQRGIGDGHVEVNLFRDDVKNTIFTQFQFVQGAAIFSFLPIDEVRTTGVELVLDQRRLAGSRFDLQINTTLTDSRIRRHAQNPSLEGNVFPRMPRVRVGMFGIYRVAADWQTSVGLRYVSNQFGALDNSDTVRNVFGAIDAYTFVDVNLSYRASCKTLRSSFTG